MQSVDLGLAYEADPILNGIDLSVMRGKITALVGPNGSGKSTLLKALARLIRPSGGVVLLEGEDITRLTTRNVARRLAMLPQGPVPPEGITVAELVAFGRFPHQGLFGQASEHDLVAVRRALELTDLVDLADHPLARLSGGQRQRAWIAMIAAQDANLILLDEPTTFLDIAYQIELLEVLRRLNAEQGRTILMVLHDLNQAARYADILVALFQGRIADQGTPAEVMTASMLQAIFGVEARVFIDEETGRPWCIPLRSTLRERADRGKARQE